MKSYNLIRNHQGFNGGFTVVEAIVAITLVVLTASAFVPLITQGFSEVFISGRRIVEVHELQNVVDTGNAQSIDVRDEGGDIQHSMVFQFESNSIVVSGNWLEAESVFDGRSSRIIVFRP